MSLCTAIFQNCCQYQYSKIPDGLNVKVNRSVRVSVPPPNVEEVGRYGFGLKNVMEVEGMPRTHPHCATTRPSPNVSFAAGGPRKRRTSEYEDFPIMGSHLFLTCWVRLTQPIMIIAINNNAQTIRIWASFLQFTLLLVISSGYHQRYCLLIGSISDL